MARKLNVWTKEQELALIKNLGRVRFVLNYYLNKTNNQYLETGKGMTYCGMAKDLTQLKKLSDFEWLSDATAATLQQSLKNLVVGWVEERNPTSLNPVYKPFCL